MKNLLLSSLLLAFACSVFAAEEDAVVVEGVLLERPDGRFIEFVLVENKMVFNFLTEEMKPEDPDVDRIAIRMKRQQPRTRTLYFVANPHDGLPGLRAPQFVQNPLLFWAYISLINDGENDPVEFYIVQYPEALTSPESIKVSGADESDSE